MTIIIIHFTHYSPFRIVAFTEAVSVKATHILSKGFIMLRKSLYGIFVFIALNITSALSSGTALAEGEPVSVDCTVIHPIAGARSYSSQWSDGLSVNLDQVFSTGGKVFSLHVEASDQFSRGVIYLRNLTTGTSGISFGPVQRGTEFRLVFERWYVFCSYQPVLAG